MRRCPGVLGRPGQRRGRGRGVSGRALRTLLVLQGAYYALTALVALAAFDRFRALVGLPINAFQAWAFGALAIPLGLALLWAGARGTAIRFAAGLGAAVALCLAFTEAIWLPRFEGRGALWLDLPVEILFAPALGFGALRRPPPPPPPPPNL